MQGEVSLVFEERYSSEMHANVVYMLLTREFTIKIIPRYCTQGKGKVVPVPN
jgi:hypothetical protein